MALSKEDKAEYFEMMRQAVAEVKAELRTEVSKDTHAAISRRLGDLKQVITPAEKDSEVPPEELSLKEQLRQLRKERDAERLEMQNEKIRNDFLSAYKGKYPDRAFQLVKDKLVREGNKTISKDEYGEPISLDKVIEEFHKEIPDFKHPLPAQGSGVKREYQGVSSPYGAGGNPDMDESAADGGSFRVKIPTLGDPTRERILGKSEQES